jgi:DNA-binding transcriptional regulator YdaS (Cro superfamily)
MTMTADELRRILMRLDPLTQERVAALLGRSPRTLRHWTLGDRPIPPEAAIVLRLLVRGRIAPADIEAAAIPPDLSRQAPPPRSAVPLP